MTNPAAIFRLIGSIVIGLVLIAAPHLQSLALTQSNAGAEVACGCSCCEAESTTSSSHDPDGCACGCSIADTEPVPESPLDAQPISVVDNDPVDQSEIVVPTNLAPVRDSVDWQQIGCEPGHSPPLFALHSSYLI